MNSPAQTHTAHIHALYRYPVKGLSPERLEAAAPGRHETLLNDRAYALENGPSGFDPAAPAWQPKAKFLCGMKNARLAALDTRFADADETLTIRRNGDVVLQENIGGEAGRAAVERFFEAFMEDEKRGPIRLLRAPGHAFTDQAKKAVSLINLASVRDLETMTGKPIHPLRFRGNIYFDGLPAWSENDLVGKTLRIGEAAATVFKTTNRCAATEVNPDTAVRDIPIPQILRERRDSLVLGIYAQIEAPGRFAEGDPIEILR
ncbi:MAG TPA: MOSC domain-containing protein [Xanthobacteraceae bacterium]|jgi:uncharacterized protein YcbX|nr:MOSC domain-containing protein [Xanthobacteraceae bacterium]